MHDVIRPLRRSKAVALSIFGMATLLSASACQQAPQASASGDAQSSGPEKTKADGDRMRKIYQSKYECYEDYSKAECESSGRLNAAGGFVYLGPWYAKGWNKPGVTVIAYGGGPGRAEVNAHKAQFAQAGSIGGGSRGTRGGFGATGASRGNSAAS
jgi:hypothetical protein